MSYYHATQFPTSCGFNRDPDSILISFDLHGRFMREGSRCASKAMRQLPSTMQTTYIELVLLLF